MNRTHSTRKRLVLLGACLLAIALLAPAASASAQARFRVASLSNTTAAPGSSLYYELQVNNVGDADADGTGGEPVVLSAQLPPGVTVEKVAPTGDLDFSLVEGWTCSGNGSGSSGGVEGATAFSCSIATVIPKNGSPGPGIVGPFITAHVDVGLASATTVSASFEVSGGGALSGSTTDPTRISGSPPPFGVDAFDFQVGEESGAAATRAGAHPFDVTTSIDFNTVSDPRPINGDLWPAEPTKDVAVDLPPGFLGNPAGVDQCTAVDLANSAATAARPLCSPSSQVGSVLVRVNAGAGGNVVVKELQGPLPVFNMVPPPGAPARFGFNVLGVPVLLDARLRSDGDYGLSIDAANVSEGLPIVGNSITFWGDPAAAVHDAERACPGVEAPIQGGPTCSVGIPDVAFLRNPTSCTEKGLATALHIDSWAHPAARTAAGTPDLSDPRWVSATSVSHEAPGYPLPPSDPGRGAEVGLGGCDKVPFTPDITVRPEITAADSPTGLDVDLTMPQEALRDPQQVAQADVKDSIVTQPVGVRINPATADGLTGCSEAQIGLIGTGFPMPNPIHFNQADPACPDSSKIGTVEIDSPLQEEPLRGFIYQARQGENPFGSTLAFYTVAQGQGLILKLPAMVRSDPQTGQVTTVFKNNPQLPFNHYRLHFFGGSRAPLITPPTCGTFTTHSTFTGWANPDTLVQTEDSFQITEGANGTPCPNGEGGRPFKPSFEAGTVNPIGGAYSPFVLKVGREDGMQELSGIETTLPPGMIGKLAGIPYCPEAAIAAARATRGLAEEAGPSCPAASQVGISDASAGAGPTPFHNPGRVYLAGPYKGAPLSVVIVTPAVAGPLDLGSVVVRVALRLDPVTTQIRAVSDPIPTSIIETGDGFPLDVRQIVVQLNRPEFTLNPTSCAPMSVSGHLTALQGASADVASRFQVADCDRLAFKPKLALELKGSTKRSGNPSFRATLTMPKAPGANIARAAVTLPHSEFLDQGHIRTVCTRVQYAAGAGGGSQCPPGSIYGHARAFSPLLDQPLEGPVVLRSSSNTLPDLVASLDGQIHVDLVGRIDTHNSGIRNTFDLVPDAPVSKFVLTMQGGKKGLLENSTALCRGTHRATVLFDGQNGKVADMRPPLKPDCKGRRAQRGRSASASGSGR
jgi:hypothetical protein